ncbi:MAG: low molecular weight phosphotyrosine protein phosphatase [Anaerolineaceae bacterium]|nr:low molecular weight phosphotyrosine protein phosphatase [Anaerolineaceae bacterium]
MESIKQIKVMFVCLGNICRSPMAEMVFQHLIDQTGLSENFIIHSSGTGSWHVGEVPHRGTQQILQENGVPLNPMKRAKKFERNNFAEYDYILAMDSDNLANLERFGKGKAKLLLEFAPQGSPMDVPDPYYTNNFNLTYQLVLQGCKGLLHHIRQVENI